MAEGVLKSYICQHQNDDEDSDEDATFDPQEEPTPISEDDDDDLTNDPSESPLNTPTKKTIIRTFSQLSSESGSPINPQRQQTVNDNFRILHFFFYANMHSLDFPAISRQISTKIP